MEEGAIRTCTACITAAEPVSKTCNDENVVNERNRG